MSFEIEGKLALVTGANRGIGRALVERFIQAGASKVYAAVRQVKSAEPLVERFGQRVVPVALDLTKPSTIAAAARTASQVELVVNNAGVLRISDALSDTAIEDLQFELDTNLFGLMRVAKAFAPVLAANGGGALVQINSIVSMKSFPQFATYCASKAAAYSITQALRLQLAAQGTEVYSVHPGPTATDMGDAAGFGDMAAPAELVGDALLAALKAGEFHVYPDPMAIRFGNAYESFARHVVEAD